MKKKIRISLSRQALEKLSFAIANGEIFWQNDEEKIVQANGEMVKIFPDSKTMANEMGYQISIPDFPYQTTSLDFLPVMTDTAVFITPLPEGNFLKPAGQNSGENATVLDDIARKLTERFGEKIVNDVYVAADLSCVYFLSVRNLVLLQ